MSCLCGTSSSRDATRHETTMVCFPFGKARLHSTTVPDARQLPYSFRRVGEGEEDTRVDWCVPQPSVPPSRCAVPSSMRLLPYHFPPLRAQFSFAGSSPNTLSSVASQTSLSSCLISAFPSPSVPLRVIDPLCMTSRFFPLSYNGKW